MAAKTVKTLDGSRTPVKDLNTEVPELLQADKKGLFGRLAALYRNLSLVMAGMYTGLNCYGTPREHHSYNADDSENNQNNQNKKKPDNRPL